MVELINFFQNSAWKLKELFWTLHTHLLLKIDNKKIEKKPFSFYQASFEKNLIRKTYFTLLELLVVLLIIGMGMALTGVKITQIYQEQKFLSESQLVLNKLSMAQDLMLIMDADVEVIIKEDPATHVFSIRLKVDKPLQKNWAHIIEEEKKLEAIRSFEFDKRQRKNLKLNFSLGSMSKGSLILSEDKNSQSNSIDKRISKIELLGYPSPLTHLSSGDKLTGQESSYRHKDSSSETLYPVEIYKKLYENAK